MEDKQDDLHSQRIALIAQIEQLMEVPISILGFIWLILLIMDMTNGLTPFLKAVSIIIWVLFIIGFILRFIIAPDKVAYIKREWLIALSLFIPAIRFIRIFRFMRILSVIQGTSIVAMIGSVNISMRALNATLKRRGFAYVIMIAIMIILAGAAGMFAFERGQPGGFASYPDAVWWTIMLFITIGSEYWPKTPAGKTLSVLISIFGFSMLGYITAMLASFFVGRDAQRKDGPIAGNNDITALHNDIEELKKIVTELKNDRIKE